MARGGARPGAGRPKAITVEVRSESLLAGRKSPLEYMLDVMNDPEADAGRRDRMAVSAAPFVHARAIDAMPGKKDQREAAAQEAASGGGKFAPPSAPKLVVSNK